MQLLVYYLEELKHDLDNGEINIEMHEVIQDNIRGVALNNGKKPYFMV